MLYLIVILLAIASVLSLDVLVKSVQNKLESAVCNLGLEPITKLESRTDENWKLYLLQRWFHDKKSCFKEDQVNRIFVTSNVYFNEDKLFTNSLIGKDSRKNYPNKREHQIDVIVGDIQLKHLKYDSYIWTGRVTNEDIYSVLHNTDGDISHSNTNKVKSHEIRSIRGPLSHASIIYNELLTSNIPNDDMLLTITNQLNRNKHIQTPVLYGDHLLLLSLLYNIRGMHQKALNSPELYRLYKKEFKNNICLMPDTSDVVPEANSFIHLNYSIFIINKNMTFTINKEFAEKYGIADTYEVYIISPELSTKETLFTMVQCKFIISVSLRGVILADSLNIPNVWLYNSVEYAGSNQGTWEFNDYYLGIGMCIFMFILVCSLCYLQSTVLCMYIYAFICAYLYNNYIYIYIYR